MNETTAKVCEEQVADLTIENAHRVTMIRKKGTDYPPVPFHFRKEHHGTGNYVGTFIKYYKISQLIHTQIIAN